MVQESFKVITSYNSLRGEHRSQAEMGKYQKKVRRSQQPGKQMTRRKNVPRVCSLSKSDLREVSREPYTSNRLSQAAMKCGRHFTTTFDLFHHKAVIPASFSSRCGGINELDG